MAVDFCFKLLLMLARGFVLLCFCGLFDLMVCGFNCGLGGWFARAV